MFKATKDVNASVGYEKFVSKGDSLLLSDRRLCLVVCAYWDSGPGCAGDPAVDLRHTNKRRGSAPPSARASRRPRPSPRTVGGALGTRPRLTSGTTRLMLVAPLSPAEIYNS